MPERREKAAVQHCAKNVGLEFVKAVPEQPYRVKVREKKVCRRGRFRG